LLLLACQRREKESRRLLAGQHQEHRLQNVVDEMRVAEQAAAHAKKHRAMPIEDRREGGLVAGLHEAVEQLPVAERALCVGQHALEQAR
jgi:hypothetical protein